MCGNVRTCINSVYLVTVKMVLHIGKVPMLASNKDRNGLINQTVRSYHLSRDPGEIFARRPKFHLKKHPRNILRNENHIHRIVLVHIMYKTALNKTKHLQMAGYRIF